MGTYDVLLMDLDDTLMDYRRDEKTALETVFTKFGLAFNEVNYLLFREINGRLWKEHEAGLITKEELLNTRFKAVFERLGRNVSGRDAEHFYRELLGKSLSLIDGALEFCEHFSKSHTLCVVTNGSRQTQIQRLELTGLGQYFKHIFISEDIGKPKPFPEFFEYVFKALPGIPPERMLITGDTLEADVRGGLDAGMDACWFNPSGLENYLELPLTYEIRSLSELAAILDVK